MENTAPKDGSKKTIPPAYSNEMKEAKQGAEEPRLVCGYTVGKKGTVEDRKVETFAKL